MELKDPCLSALMKAIDDLIFIFNGEGRYLQIWAKDESRLFRPREELLGKTLEEALGPKKAAPYLEMLERCIRTGEQQDFEYSGEPFVDRWFLGRMNQVKMPQGQDPIYTFLVRDVTESRRLKILLEASQAAQVNSSKLAALGEMAGGIAHEINNPLTILQVRTMQMQAHLKKNQLLDSTLELELKKISETCDRISKIVRGLKSVARNADQDPLQPHSLSQVVEDILSLCRERFRAQRIELDVQIKADAICSVRHIQIGQALLNLLNNAFDAVSELSERWVKVTLDVVNGQALLTVQDSGEGITPEVQDRMMDPFFTTKSIGKGTGLGLSISKSILEQHDGQLLYLPNQKHTTFQIQLPQCRAKGVRDEVCVS